MKSSQRMPPRRLSVVLRVADKLHSFFRRHHGKSLVDKASEEHDQQHELANLPKRSNSVAARTRLSSVFLAGQLAKAAISPIAIFSQIRTKLKETIMGIAGDAVEVANPVRLINHTDLHVAVLAGIGSGISVIPPHGWSISHTWSIDGFAAYWNLDGSWTPVGVAGRDGKFSHIWKVSNSYWRVKYVHLRGTANNFSMNSEAIPIHELPVGERSYFEPLGDPQNF